MITTIWQDILTEDDQQVIESAGYTGRGASTFKSRGSMTRPALLIIDMQRLFVGEDVPILEAIAQQPTMIGERGWRAMEAMQPLIATCRQCMVPIIYARMIPHNRTSDDPLLAIMSPIQPQADDTLLDKTTSSAFFHTGLAEHLAILGVDSVMLIGNSTSGCIRAAAVDAVQHGLTAIIPHECVFDRIEASHKISLLDLWMKYAVVTDTADVIAQVTALHEVNA
ncbi:MAG: isochorismatase family protein [Anaerolineae bacterium]